ncbi:MAG: WD40 repeat domain-containing protein, partial [Actinomycetes bacterium]
YFTYAGDTRRNRAAAVGTNGTLTTWNPNLNDGVSALAVSGSTVYLAGSFTTVGSTTRNRAAAVGTDGTLATWNPDISGQVNALAISGSTVYLGGSFWDAGGSTRKYAAAFGTDGTLTSWDPSLNDDVYALTVSGSTIYLGGNFTTVGGTTRNYAAAFGTDGTLTTWNPDLSSSSRTYVKAIAVSGSTVYLGGYFTAAGGTERNRAAAVGTDGTLTTWNPNLNSEVKALAVSGSTVYLGGWFTSAGGTTRNHAAAVETGGTLLPQWPGPYVPTPVVAPAKPTVTWSASARAKTITALITPTSGLTYKLTAKQGSKTKTGACRNVTIKQGRKKLARRSCSVKLAKGTWLASLTPSKGTIKGAANSRRYRFR